MHDGYFNALGKIQLVNGVMYMRARIPSIMTIQSLLKFYIHLIRIMLVLKYSRVYNNRGHRKDEAFQKAD
jgi:hypothetical protein